MGPKERRTSMSEFQDSANVHTIGAPRWVGLAVAVLGGISLISLGVGWSALNQARNVEQSTQATVKQTNEALAQRLAKADEINQQLQSDVKVVTDKLNLTQGELITARKQNQKSTSSAAWAHAITSNSPCSARAGRRRSAAFKSN